MTVLVSMDLRSNGRILLGEPKKHARRSGQRRTSCSPRVPTSLPRRSARSSEAPRNMRYTDVLPLPPSLIPTQVLDPRSPPLDPPPPDLPSFSSPINSQPSRPSQKSSYTPRRAGRQTPQDGFLQPRPSPHRNVFQETYRDSSDSSPDEGLLDEDLEGGEQGLLMGSERRVTREGTAREGWRV
jgi:hypothetical protein